MSSLAIKKGSTNFATFKREGRTFLVETITTGSKIKVTTKASYPSWGEK
ncbi:hypothetical protein EVB91_294 [Rhizobium phage RHph_I1_18]|nr:hypothetical protein EVB91_294 [Rhizobium phage RHph_I1_18]